MSGFPRASLESISFQSDKFFRDIVAVIDKYRNTFEKEKKVVDYEMELAALITKRTHIPYKVDLTSYDTFSTTPPHIDKNSPLVEGYGWNDSNLSKGSISELRKTAKNESRAMVDTDAMVVGGYFTRIDPVQMFLYRKHMGVSQKYTSEELAAIILHEIGHVFTMFSFLVRFRTTNQILQAAARELDQTDDYGKREMIVREAATAMNLDDIDAKDLSTKKDTTIHTVFITSLARKNKSQSGEEGYDINSFEALADQFATRNGAGLHLVTALDKINKNSIHGRTNVGYFFMETVKLITFGLGVFATSLAISAAAPLIMLSAYNMFVMTATLVFIDSHFDWYDKAGYRMKRIKDQLITKLKDPNLSKSDSARIQEDLKVIEEINAKYKDHTQLIGLVYDYLIPSGINKRKNIEFQQQLETLSSNKLFVYANQIKHS